MCGIIGSFPAADAQWVKHGIHLIQHRGPDDNGQVNTRWASLGHTRLAILDVAQGQQPMSDGNLTIVFNGEIYNYQSLINKIPEKIDTRSDTRVVLKLYQYFGPDCVQWLDGMFAFAIQDGRQLFLARDPLGIKPLYYAQVNGVMHFASEIKALKSYLPAVREFPAGSCWHSRTGFKKYYTMQGLKAARKPQGKWAQAKDIQQIYQTIDQAVQKRMIADEGVPVGVSLSGGLDSSIIAALARKSRQNLDTFAVGMEGSPDLAASQLVARHLKTQHHICTYTFTDMLKALPDVIYYLESYDAALVRSAIPNYFLARLAAQDVKVILTGEGADELFAGYEYLRSVDDPQQLQDELWTITGNLHNTNLQRTDRMTMAHGLEGRVPFLDTAVIRLAFQLPPAWKAPWQDRPEKALLREAFEADLPGKIIRRPKQKFSQGTGSADLMADYAHQKISDSEFAAAKQAGLCRSKEELLYYKIFKEQFGAGLHADVIGQTRSITASELH